jgi:hypothetical protein
MEHIISYKVAQSFHIGMDITEETTKRYIQAVIDALKSGHALFDESYEYPIHGTNIITEHKPDSDKFFTYIDFKIQSQNAVNPENGEDLEKLRGHIVDWLSNDKFELVILWKRSREAHIVFEFMR